MPKSTQPLVFISHITEEKQLADVVRILILTAFPHVEVFQSSDEGHSLPSGQNRIDNITTALKSCSVLLVLCSAESIGRPWINFEAGGGWARGITVSPICHSTMNRDDLPLPLKLQTSHNADDVDDIRQMLNAIAVPLKSRQPVVNLDGYISEVRKFSDEYKFIPIITKIFEYLLGNATFFQHPRTGAGFVISDTIAQSVYDHLQHLSELDVLRVRETPSIRVNHRKFIGIQPLPLIEDPLVQQFMRRFNNEVIGALSIG